MSRFMTLVATTYTLNAAITLWNLVDLFNINSILVDNTNTVQGLFNSWFCSSSNNNIITSCTNNILIILGVLSLISFGSGLVTLAAFGNTFQAYAIFLSFVPCMYTFYNTIVSVMDVFGVSTTVAAGIGGLFGIVMAIWFSNGIIKIQAKVDMGP